MKRPNVSATIRTSPCPQSPSAREKVFEELARVLPDGRSPSFADTRELKYIMRCINESMRLYPHPPVRSTACKAPTSSAESGLISWSPSFLISFQY